MGRNPPDRYFSVYARGRKKQAPGLIRTARQSRVAKMIRKARGSASKHRYDWIPEEGIAPGQNPRRRRRRNEQLGILWKQYEYHGSTIQETGRGRWKVYTPGGSVSPTLTSKRSAERWARVYGGGGKQNPMAQKKRKKRKTTRARRSTRKVKRNTSRARRRTTTRRKNTRRRNRKITFPVPVTPAQKKKLARWLRTNFGKRVRVK